MRFCVCPLSTVHCPSSNNSTLLDNGTVHLPQYPYLASSDSSHSCVMLLSPQAPALSLAPADCHTRASPWHSTFTGSARHYKTLRPRMSEQGNLSVAHLLPFLPFPFLKPALRFSHNHEAHQVCMRLRAIRSDKRLPF